VVVRIRVPFVVRFPSSSVKDRVQMKAYSRPLNKSVLRLLTIRYNCNERVPEDREKPLQEFEERIVNKKIWSECSAFFGIIAELSRAALIICMFATLSFGQSPRFAETNATSWWIYSGDHPISGHWGVFTEVQARRADFLAIWQQLQFRDAATYRISPHIQLAGGYVWTRTGRYGVFSAAKPSLEHRIYEQLVLKQEFSHGDLEHRYRVEQRWLQNFTTGDNFFWRYQNRFRYQLKGSLPISAADTHGRQWLVFGAGELFVHFGPNHGPTAFDQTRAFGGIGYKLSKHDKIEFAYQHQFISQRNGLINESNHGLRVQFSSNAKL
jgi:uncharacterized protein DUF2490